MAAPLPTPQYIDYIDNILPLISTDKILVADNNSTAIPTAEANQLIAAGEAQCLWDLSPYYVTVPNLVTTTGGLWTTLPYYTYVTLYNMFVWKASVILIRSFIERNTDAQRTLSKFVEEYEHNYNETFTRIRNKLPNGSYEYQLIGLQTVNVGIPRIPQQNALSGRIGVSNNYTERQLTNPQNNFNGLFPYWGW